ncbi:MAG: putative LPS assembly protein LptD [Bacteroides sp.]|nr:putative LPS assembly protein LptD [Bacteroides sp.]
MEALAADTAAVDSVPAKKKDGLDAPVTYEANDSIVFTQDGYAHLYGQGKVVYQQTSKPIELTADVITMNMDSSTVYAHGVEDSVGALKGTPIFKDGETPYETNTIRYNFKSKRGIISNVVSQQGEGYVTGNNAKKGVGDELYMKNGRYTTCDNHEHPHFYMQMTYAKVRPKKNVVTGPAYLVVEDVPLPLAVPFFFFPFSSSYQSGFIMPTYMDDSSRGFGLTDGGYYFAISDQMDLKVLADIFTKGSWAVSASSKYIKRYRYSGSFQGSYQVTKTGDKGLPDYSVAKDFKIVWSHSQDAKANPNQTFSASVNYSTSSYERTNVSNLYNSSALTTNTKTSSISYTRYFFNKKLTVSATSNISQTLKDSSVSVTLPDLNISLTTIYPFKRKKAVGNERWYEKISLRYTGRLKNSIDTKDDLLFKSNLIKDWENGMQHQIPVSATFTLFKYFNVTPSVSYTERWYTHKIMQDWDTEAQAVARDTIYGFYRVYNYSASASVNTKIYAMYKPIIFPKKNIQIRHVITPSVSYSMSPDFGAARYGYWDSYTRTYTDGTQDTVTYSPYAGQAFSPPSRGRSGSISFSISNNVEMKYTDKNDSVRKVSLIDALSASISYNTAATTRPWSNLSMSLRLKLGKNYTFSMSSTFATYAYTFDKNGNVTTSDRTEWSYGRFGRFQGYGNSFSWSLNNDSWKKIKAFFTGEKTDDDKKTGEGDEGSSGETADSAGTGTSGRKTEKKKAEVDADGYKTFSIPWTLNLSTGFNITEDTSKPINRKSMRYPYKFSLNALNISGSVQLSNKWSISYSSGYDFDDKEIVQTTFTVTRDLHCFSMTASIAPLGTYKYYSFKISANASILQDLKWDKRSQTSSTVQWY